ncbi:hypothetical protein LJC23_04310 [Desulfovibrio sp. OttesenSCG-928-I05]|nr:hypothetical protein [Desulfovibrio sp. OttesenSCG-928-I05]
MGGTVKKIIKSTKKAVKGIFGGSSNSGMSTGDYEKQLKAAENEAIRKRAALAEKGMGGTLLGGSLGDASGIVKKKLGE